MMCYGTLDSYHNITEAVATLATCSQSTTQHYFLECGVPWDFINKMPRTKPKQKKGKTGNSQTQTNPFEIRKQHVKKKVLNSRTRGTTQQAGKARALAQTKVCFNQFSYPYVFLYPCQVCCSSAVCCLLLSYSSKPWNAQTHYCPLCFDIWQRDQTLGLEHQRRYNTNKFIDRRFVGVDDSLSPEEKNLILFQREKTKLWDKERYYYLWLRLCFSILDGDGDLVKLTHKGTDLDLLLIDEDEDKNEEEALFDEVHSHSLASSYSLRKRPSEV